MLKNPIGIDNFKEIVKNCYYVDKTMIIREIVKMPNTSTILFTRPRRFGKSLALNMLFTFFTKTEDNREYFVNTHIYHETNIIDEYLNKYDVIYLNFKDIESESKEELLRLTKKTIIKEIMKYQVLLNQLDSNIQPLYRYMFDVNSDVLDFSSCLKDICFLINKVTQKRPIILIDEYDKPLQSAYEHDYYDDCSEFFKRLYSEAFKSNDNLEYGILTGVTKASKLSLFSGLNNINVDTIIDNNYSSFFGFTENETMNLLDNFNLKDRYQDVLDWYGGFKFGDTSIVNPWSLLNFCKNQGKLRTYWSSTSSPILINKLINKNYLNISNEIKCLIEKESVFLSIDESTNYSDINISTNSLLTFLLFMGYFTINHEFSGGYLIGFSNIETKKIFSNELKSILIGNSNMNLVYDLSNSFLIGDGNTFGKLLEKYMLSSFSYFDFNDEKNYQIMLLTIFSLIFEEFSVKSEVISGDGRCDILISPKDTSSSFGSVIEIKYLSYRTTNDRLNTSSEKALNQIIKHNYCQDLINNNNITNIYAYGISFFKNHVSVSQKKIR